MEIVHWICGFRELADGKPQRLKQALIAQGISADILKPGFDASPDIYIFSEFSPDLQRRLQAASCSGLHRVIAIAESEREENPNYYWDLLRAGASDILVWSDPEVTAREIKVRFERWRCVEQLMEEPDVRGFVVAKSPMWRSVLRDVAETARFSDATVLLLGESGTGKEVVAKLIHLLDTRPDKRDLVILDCSTITPELSGSEFFGHERGSFTGASSERKGAFELANGGTLFLDEIGELPLPLQAQLLRVIQERTYKRVGGNIWHRTEFRLVCATNRDLLKLVRCGGFRADLYYRIAGCICHLPPLRDRLEDIVPLAEHFMRDVTRSGDPPELDVAVRNYLLQREYPGNIRDLRQVLMRIMSRHTGGRSVTIGSIPSDEWPSEVQCDNVGWLDANFERQIHRAVLLGAGLKEIGHAAEEIAIQYATAEEKGNVRRAARRLGVTDRALQLRRATRRKDGAAKEFAAAPILGGSPPESTLDRH